MKKYFLLFLFSILLLSCSKGGKITISGNVKNGSPLERIELIEASGVATLPITNFGVDAKGNFSQNVDIPKDGIYVLTYGGRNSFLYLKGGDKVNLQIDAMMFPTDVKISGDAKANTEYIKEGQEFINQYMSKINPSVISKGEDEFLKELDKYKADITKKLEEIAKTKKPDSDVVKFNKRELDVTMLLISTQYENMHGQATNNPNYKPSAKYIDYQKKLENEAYVADMPTYRSYMLNKLSSSLQKYFEANRDIKVNSNTEMFSKFLDTQKDISDKTKDYLLATVASQYDIQPNNPKIPELIKFLDTKIKNADLKADLKKVEEAVYGIKLGTDYSKTELLKQDGKKSSLAELKGKPTTVFFYASWNPYFNENAVPVLKEMVKFYGSKMNFAFVNLDDTKDQFMKTSKAVFNGVKGVSFYGEGGLNSEIAKQFAIYGFKMPSFVVLDKDGKVMSKNFLNIGDPELVDALNKASGLQAPTAAPVPQMMPQMQQPAAAPAK